MSDKQILEDISPLDSYFEAKAHTVQSQYSNSKNINALIDSFSEHISPQEDINTFFTNIFDIYTTKGYGLDIWGRIIGLERYIILKDLNSNDEQIFGFHGSNLLPFDNGPFKYSTITNTHRLEDEAYRKYLFLVQAYKNIAQTNFQSMNTILAVLFPETKQYILQGENMSMKFVFEFILSDVERAIIKQGLLTASAGVSYQYIEVEKSSTFGFTHSEFVPFDNGVFVDYARI